MELLMATHFILESDDREDGDYYTRLEVAGEGDLEHYIGAFKAFLLAVGHDPHLVEALMPDEDDIREYRNDWRNALDEMNRQMDADQHPLSEHEQFDFDPQGRERNW